MIEMVLYEDVENVVENGNALVQKYNVKMLQIAKSRHNLIANTRNGSRITEAVSARVMMMCIEEARRTEGEISAAMD